MATEAAVSKDGFSIPLIDFSKFLNGTPSEREDTAKAVLDGFQNVGFIYLKNHPVSKDALKGVFSMSSNFFNQPFETKKKIDWTTPQANRGYSAPGREKTSRLTDASEIEKLRQAMPDLKETLDIGREDEPELPNRWPEETGDLAGFKAAMLEFWGQCRDLHVEVMRAIGVGMGFDEKFFDGYVDESDNTLRILHYPEVQAKTFKSNPETLRCGEHSDYGSITLLFQDNRGGLQVQSPSGQFVDATPIEGTVVINAGDLLARWSNDTIKSTVHRVVEPPTKESEVYRSRYSIAYFCNPNATADIEVLPGTYATEADKKYASINSGDYLVQRLAATY